MNDLKVFTVEEANRLLPELTRLLGELKGVRDQIGTHEVHVDLAEMLTGAEAKGVSPQMDQAVESYNVAVKRAYTLVDEIHHRGCFLKDIDLGLVDFYTRHHGEIVYLCWRLGEPEIRWWHEVGKGFAQRQPLEASPEQNENAD